MHLHVYFGDGIYNDILPAVRLESIHETTANTSGGYFIDESFLVFVRETSPVGQAEGERFFVEGRVNFAISERDSCIKKSPKRFLVV